MSLPLAVTMGEPAGIGGELTLMAWLLRNQYEVPYFFVCDDAERLSLLAQHLKLPVQIACIRDITETAAAWEYGVPVLPLKLVQPSLPGTPSLATASNVIHSIRRTVSLVQAQKAAALVTNPIHKSTLHKTNFPFPGHTEYLAHLVGKQGESEMLLIGGGLRVVPVTRHMSLRSAIANLSPERLITCARTVIQALSKNFGIPSPHLAVAGLNPHAGEDGNFGTEEQEIIKPAVIALQAEGFSVSGPYPPDTLFHTQARTLYDCVLCMYHDQALIPVKTIAFDTAVNVTLGLPFVRTSPDHGTALSIAGSGKANPTSFLEALRLAASLSTPSKPIVSKGDNGLP